MPRRNVHDEDFEEEAGLTAFDNHDPALEPYASMTRDEIRALMMEPDIDPARSFFLEQFLLDKMTTRELDLHTKAQELATYLMGLWQANGNEQCAFLCRVAGRVAAEIAEGMPPVGPPEECN